MKRTILLLSIFIIIQNTRATILTVSNSSAYSAQYVTISAAITAATAGDTIYVYATGVFYNENPSITKRIVIIGGGSQTQGGAWMSSFSISTANANGTVISGLGIAVQPSISSNNVGITDCQINSSGDNIHVYGNNFLLENCILQCGIRFETYGQANVIVRNNLIYAGITARPGITGTFTNNVFSSSSSNDGSFGDIQSGEGWGNGVTISNNIFFKRNIYNYVTASCPYINNIYYLTLNGPPSNIGSSGNVNADPQFENYPVAGTSSFNLSHSYKLLTSSPGHNYGTDGTDLGVWGSLNPINAFFYPPLPRVTSITATNNTVPPGGQLQITIKATKAQ